MRKVAIIDNPLHGLCKEAIGMEWHFVQREATKLKVVGLMSAHNYM